ncbi:MULTISPECIES: acyl-CoA dehydrogenase [unclassified Frigoribacterium]|uniref:acyl-CoA dehydrogenase n=1 Tax=unclassified Frigoribacterium TaxID=2627005 RepID=UPI001AEB9470|nr:acyl-CoA dehydrogenase [Frigoribacterium sp. PvP121]MBP1240466.1 hypothetical protein [Frigoribacterium sp. PvP121]
MHLSRAVPPGSTTSFVRAHLPASVAEALGLAASLTDPGAQGGAVPAPGTGQTADLWRALATLAAHDLSAARAVEPHLDAVAVLEQAREAGQVAPTATDAAGSGGRASAAGPLWGVFAAEGPGVRLDATRAPAVAVDPADPGAPAADGAATAAPERWTLTGVKPWCSLADQLDAALVTAWAGDERRLFAVDLHQPGVEVVPGTWHARGLVEIPSGPVRFDDVAASPVGEPGWYLRRPGFEWGGIGVAACWYGGAVGVARTLHAATVGREPDPWRLRALGVVDERLGDARRALAEAADLVDAGEATGREGRLLAKRVRGTVARAADDVLRVVGRALGPAPLALDAAHAARVADLELYLRQHHAEKDEASLGGAVRELALGDGADAPGEGVDPW